jgi:two-component system cell cycle sensor histidine kinase/response regulator CckA
MRWKLVLLVSLLIAAISVFMYLYIPSELESKASQILKQKASSIVHMTARNLSRAGRLTERATVEEAWGGAKLNQDVTFLLLENDVGQILASYNEEKALRLPFTLARKESFVSSDGNVFVTSAPVIQGDRNAAYVYLGLSLENLKEEIRWSRTTIAIVSIIIFILSVAAVYGISILAMAPLTDMVKTVEQIARGNFSRRAGVFSQDEIGHLAKSFNLMVDKLEATRRELQYGNRTLETRVAERTKELIAEINERKLAETKVREQAALLDVSRDAIIVRDPQDTILFWNKGAENLYGWIAEGTLGRKATPLLQENPIIFKEAINAVMQKGQWRSEITHKNRNGKEITVESRWTLMNNMMGVPKSVLVVNTDITEKKQLEKQFLRAQRMESIGTLAGGIAHDLNNVLAPILMSVQMFKKKLMDDQSQRIIGSLESSAKRGADMVKQVLTFARGVEGEHGVLQPKHLVREMESIVKETFPKSIEIHTDIPKDLWTLFGDATQLHQVLLNLCVNARDAMPEGGKLTLAAENAYLEKESNSNGFEAKAGRYIALKVRDTGSGIPQDVLDKIFEPFFTTKEVGKGTGLGLSTVHSIVKSHSGMVKVKSELGKGTEFIVYLPALESGDVAMTTERKGDLPTGDGELVLVVDDEAAVCQITRATLESYGYRGLSAKDGREAIEVYYRNRGEIKCVITDMMMPMMGGEEVIKTIRGLNDAVKIIASSGFVKDSIDIKALQVEAFLPKPYTADKLLKVLDEVMHPHRQVVRVEGAEQVESTSEAAA